MRRRALVTEQQGTSCCDAELTTMAKRSIELEARADGARAIRERPASGYYQECVSARELYEAVVHGAAKCTVMRPGYGNVVQWRYSSKAVTAERDEAKRKAREAKAARRDEAKRKAKAAEREEVKRKAREAKAAERDEVKRRAREAKAAEREDFKRARHEAIGWISPAAVCEEVSTAGASAASGPVGAHWLAGIAHALAAHRQRPAYGRPPSSVPRSGCFDSGTPKYSTYRYRGLRPERYAERGAQNPRRVTHPCPEINTDTVATTQTREHCLPQRPARGVAVCGFPPLTSPCGRLSARVAGRSVRNRATACRASHPEIPLPRKARTPRRTRPRPYPSAHRAAAVRADGPAVAISRAKSAADRPAMPRAGR